MSVLAVWGAASSLLAAAVEGLALLPRPGLPIVGVNSPIAALPMAALLALEAAVLIGLLQNGWRAITPDEWERLVDKDNYEIVYDYDYAEPYRRLIYYPASAPDDSEAYFDSAEAHGEEHAEEEHAEGETTEGAHAEEGGGGEHTRRVSQNTPYGPYPQYPPQSPPQYQYPAQYPPQYPAQFPSKYPSKYGAQTYPRPQQRRYQATRYSGPQNAYPPPQRLSYHRYKRNINNMKLNTGLEEITKAVEELEVEEDQEILAEEIKELSGQVLRLDRDHCLLKLLCHLQKKPQEERGVQDVTLLRVFGIQVAQGELGCGDEFPQCPVDEVQLVEAFSYLWQLQNDV